MATITVSEPGAVVAVKNGDRVVLDIPDGSYITIVAANPNVRNFRIDFGDDADRASEARFDTSTFGRDNLQLIAVGYSLELDLSEEMRKENVLGLRGEVGDLKKITGNRRHSLSRI